MYEIVENAEAILFSPLSGIGGGWMRWVALVVCFVVYFAITVWIARLGLSSVGGIRPFLGCTAALLCVLFALALAEEWLPELFPAVSDKALMASAFALAWLAICTPLTAWGTETGYAKAMVAWMLGLLAAWLAAYFLVFLWGAVKGGSINVKKMQESGRLFKDIIR